MLMPPSVMYEQHDLNSLINAVRGYTKKQDRKKQEAWDQTRFNTFHLLNIQLAAKDKLKSYTDLVRFPWEPEPVKPQLDGNILKQIIKKR